MAAEKELLDPTTRQAIQAAVAGAAAIVIGRWISADRWFWAVLAAYVVVSREQSRGAILVRAGHRALGTVVGVALGMLLAASLHGHPRLSLIALFLCVFLAFYSMRTSYFSLVLWFTALLAILYSLLGRYTHQLLYVRIEETVAGSVLGAAAAALILPTRTGGTVRRALERVLSSAAELIAAMARESDSTLLVRARALDQSLAELRTNAEPLTRSFVPIATETVELVHDVSTLVFYLRQLSTPGLLATALPERPEELGRILTQLSETARALSNAVAGRPAAACVDVRPELKSMREGVADTGLDARAGDPLARPRRELAPADVRRDEAGRAEGLNDEGRRPPESGYRPDSNVRRR